MLNHRKVILMTVLCLFVGIGSSYGFGGSSSGGGYDSQSDFGEGTKDLKRVYDKLIELKKSGNEKTVGTLPDELEVGYEKLRKDYEEIHSKKKKLDDSIKELTIHKQQLRYQLDQNNKILEARKDSIKNLEHTEMLLSTKINKLTTERVESKRQNDKLKEENKQKEEKFEQFKNEVEKREERVLIYEKIYASGIGFGVAGVLSGIIYFFVIRLPKWKLEKKYLELQIKQNKIQI